MALSIFVSRGTRHNPLDFAHFCFLLVVCIQLSSIQATAQRLPSEEGIKLLGKLQGLVTIESHLPTANGEASDKRQSFFVQVIRQAGPTAEGTLNVLNNVRRFPPESEIWSQKKLEETKPIDAVVVRQSFPTVGDKVGLATPDSPTLPPVVEGYYFPLLFPLLCPKEPVLGAKLECSVPVSNPGNPNAAPWKATLSLKIAAVNPKSVTVAYTHVTDNKVRAVEGKTVHYQFESKGTVVYDRERRCLAAREGQQSSRLVIDKAERAEKVTFQFAAAE